MGNQTKSADENRADREAAKARKKRGLGGRKNKGKAEGFTFQAVKDDQKALRDKQRFDREVNATINAWLDTVDNIGRVEDTIENSKNIDNCTVKEQAFQEMQAWAKKQIKYGLTFVQTSTATTFILTKYDKVVDNFLKAWLDNVEKTGFLNVKINGEAEWRAFNNLRQIVKTEKKYALRFDESIPPNEELKFILAKNRN